MQQTYAVGSHVRYGVTGFGRSDGKEDFAFSGQAQPRRGLVRKPLRYAGIEVSVPLDNAVLCGKIRPLLTKDEIDAMLDAALHAEDLPWNEDRKLRSQEFRKLLAAGDSETLLALVRTILHRKAELRHGGKRLSSADENARKDAERMLDEEFAFSLGVTPEEAGRYIRSKLQGDAVQ